jgi:hypothetical protein
MPKPKPDKVIRHEIVLGRSERDMLEGWFSSMTFNNVATPTVDLLNDVTGMATFLSLLSVAGLTGVGFTFLVSPEMEMSDLIDSFVSQREQAKAEAGLQSVENIYEGAGLPTQGIDFLQSLLGFE